MVCAYCGGPTQVINSRLQKRSNQVWRRRSCLRCGALFTTHEAVQLGKSFTVAHGKQVEPFTSDKLFTEVLLAVADQPRCYEAARELTSTIIQNLQKKATKPLFEAHQISTEAASVLKRYNRRAYLRYMAEHPSLQSIKKRSTY